MSQIIPIGEFLPGTRVEITNGSSRSSLYDISFGDCGGISFTLIPGASFALTVGIVKPDIQLHDAEPPGIRIAVPPDDM